MDLDRLEKRGVAGIWEFGIVADLKRNYICEIDTKAASL